MTTAHTVTLDLSRLDAEELHQLAKLVTFAADPSNLRAALAPIYAEQTARAERPVRVASNGDTDEPLREV